MKRETMRRVQALSCTALLFCAGAARAVDGVIEINHASATATGYPVVISTSGSYVLTGNLTPPAGLDAIHVIVPGAEIDLNGFSITGAGGPSGIFAPGIPGLTVRRGTITGFAGAGILAGPDAKVFQTRLNANGIGISGAFNCLIVENVISANPGGGILADSCKIENNAIESSGTGILGRDNVVAHNKITGNPGGGILSFGGSTIQQNIITSNGAFGISDGSPGVPIVPPPVGGPPRNNIIGNVIDNNFGGPGIVMSIPTLITDNTISNNFREGIDCGAACTVRGNVVETNNLSGMGVGGVTVAAGSNVTGNNISFNIGVGLTLSPVAGYSNNTLAANTGVEVVPAAHFTDAFDNVCDGAAC